MEKNLKSISLIVPTYNNESTVVEELINAEKTIQKYTKDYEIIISDDYSRDSTQKLLIKFFNKNSKFILSFNKKNLGITKNIKKLYSMTSKNFIIFYSADGDWKYTDIEKLIKTQLKKQSSIVIGKRTKKIGYTITRKIVSFLHRLLPLIMFGVDTIDPGGIKLLSKDVVGAKIICNSQLFEAEMIIRAVKNGKKISHCMVSYEKPFTGSGKGGNLKDAINSAIDLFRLRFSFWGFNL